MAELRNGGINKLNECAAKHNEIDQSLFLLNCFWCWFFLWCFMPAVRLWNYVVLVYLRHYLILASISLQQLNSETEDIQFGMKLMDWSQIKCRIIITVIIYDFNIIYYVYYALRCIRSYWSIYRHSCCMFIKRNLLIPNTPNVLNFISFSLFQAVAGN